MHRKFTPFIFISLIIITGSALGLTTQKSSKSESATNPKAFWVSQPVKPAETALISGGNISTDAFIEVARVQDATLKSPLSVVASNLKWKAVKPLQASTSAVKFVVPESFKQGLFAYRLTSGGQTSSTYYINKADVWFIQGDQGRTATPGGSIQLIGTALALPEGMSREKPAIALVDSNSNVTLIDADSDWNANFKTAGYAQSFTLPAYLALGDYTLYYNNGYGGCAGWSLVNTFRSPQTPLTQIGNSSYPVPSDKITVAAPLAWPSTVVEMLAPVPEGTDDANFTAVFAKLQANNGGILAIPAGTYNLTQPLVVPANVVIQGSGKKTTILNWSVEPIYGSGNAKALISGQTTKIQNYWGYDKFSVENLSITTTAPHVGAVIEVWENHTGDPVHIKQVSINVPGGNTSSTATFGVSIFQTENVAISDTDINATSAVVLSNAYYVSIENCNFNYTHSSVDVASSNNVYVAHNHFTVTKGYIFDGTIYGMTVSGASLADDVYFGDNLADRVGAPDQSLGSMSFDNVAGSFFGTGVVANGTTLTFPSAVSGSMAVAMILSGTGTGQWRWVLGGAGTSSTQVTLDRPWDLPPDANSAISLVGMVGRVIFAGNSYFQQAGWTVAYYMTSDVIQANNTTTSDVPAVYVGQRASAVVPGWHYQVLGNHTLVSTNPANISANYGSYSQVLATANSWYTNPVMAFHVYRNNLFDTAVPGSLQIDANSSAAAILVEGNKIPQLMFTANANSPGVTILDSMYRLNTSSLGSGALGVTLAPTTLNATVQSFP